MLPYQNPDQNDAGAAPDDAARQRVLDLLIADAPFSGFTPSALVAAAHAAGLGADLPVLFPKGIADALAYWSLTADRAMLEALPAEGRIRDRITALVAARVLGLAPHREAARRAAATLALPGYAGLAQRLAWQTADAMWRALGDQSLDFNHYTKRATLSAVYLSTLARFFAETGGTDTDPPYPATRAFLDARIANVMAFEKLKADIGKSVPDLSKMMSALGGLRYGGRH